MKVNYFSTYVSVYIRVRYARRRRANHLHTMDGIRARARRCGSGGGGVQRRLKRFYFHRKATFSLSGSAIGRRTIKRFHSRATRFHTYVL